VLNPDGGPTGWWGFVPVVGDLWTAGANFAKENYFWGLAFGGLAVLDFMSFGFIGAGLRGIARLGTRTVISLPARMKAKAAAYRQAYEAISSSGANAARHTIIGDFGEAMVYNQLKARGYQNLSAVKNTSNNGLDIVGVDPNGIIKVVEVRTRTSTSAIQNLRPPMETPRMAAQRIVDSINNSNRYNQMPQHMRAHGVWLQEQLRQGARIEGEFVRVDLEEFVFDYQVWQ
jgi:Holliday junction resolvase-like predicted endonuclease